MGKGNTERRRNKITSIRLIGVQARDACLNKNTKQRKIPLKAGSAELIRQLAKRNINVAKASQAPVAAAIFIDQ
jgi:hypothetical protein